LKKFLLIFFVVLLCSFVFSQSIGDSEIDVSILFSNAAKTVDVLFVHVPVLGESESILNEVSVDSVSLVKYMDRFNIPESERDSWLESNVLEEDFEIVEGSAHRIKNEKGEFSDYFVWVKEIDFDKEQIVGYVMTGVDGYGVGEDVSENAVIETVSLREFRKVDCGVKGKLGFGESYSCLLPELDGSTITITIKSVYLKKKLVSLGVKWSFSFFRDVFWEDRWLNVEFAGGRDGFVVRKDSEDELIKYSDLMAENPEQYVFKFPGEDSERNVNYLVFVSGLYSEEVRFEIGYVDLDKEVSWLDLESSKEFNADRIPKEFIAFKCAPDELWVDELVFTKEDLNKGRNVKTCVVSGFSEPTEIIRVKVDSISNNGKTVSFKVKHYDVSSALDEILRLAEYDYYDPSMLEIFGSQIAIDLFLAYSDEFVEIARAAKWSSPLAFRALAEENVSAFFVSNSDVVVEAFVEIANAIGPGLSRKTFMSIVLYDGVSGLFVEFPDEFVEVVKASDTRIDYVLVYIARTISEVGRKKLLDDYIAYLKSEKEILDLFTVKYGVRPMKMAGFLDRKAGIIDSPEYDIEYEKEVYAAIKQNAEEKNLDPEFLAAAMFQEGFVLLMDKRPEEYSIDSIAKMGMDAFYSDLDSLKIEGYIRDDFVEGIEFKLGEMRNNEVGFSVQMVYFKDTFAVVEAFSSMLAQRRDNFLDAADEMGVDIETLSQEQIRAGSYLFYNAANPKSLLKKDGLENLLRKYASTDNRYRFNYMRVVSTANYLKYQGIFESE